jgi:hypothetical protein
MKKQEDFRDYIVSSSTLSYILRGFFILVVLALVILYKVTENERNIEKIEPVPFAIIDSCVTDTTYFESRITVYSPTRAQTDESPFATADGSIIDPKNPKRWVAVSKGLLHDFPFGSKLYIKCDSAPIINGEYEVHDTGCADGIDILIANPDVCDLRGCWKGVIYKIDTIETSY